MNTLSNILMTIMIIASIFNSSEAQVKFTHQIGGKNGTKFMLPNSRSAVLSTKQITGIAIQHSRRIEQIVVEYADDQDIIQVESIGNDTGDWSYFELEDGEHIIYITGRSGTLIDQITFHTSRRRTFGPFGGNGGQEFEITIPSDARVIGFTGHAGPSINRIGLIYKRSAKTVDVSKYLHKGTIYHGTPSAKEGNKPKRTVRDHRTSKLTKMTAGNTMNNNSGFTIRDSMVYTKPSNVLTREVKVPFRKKLKSNKKRSTTRLKMAGNRNALNQRKIK